MQIAVLSPCNLNLGDNAILFTWLGVYNKFLTSSDTVTILGGEIGSIAQYTDAFRFKIVCNDQLTRHFWGYPQNHQGWSDAVEALSPDTAVDPKAYFPAHYTLCELFSRIAWFHVVGGGDVK